MKKRGYIYTARERPRRGSFLSRRGISFTLFSLSLTHTAPIASLNASLHHIRGLCGVYSLLSVYTYIPTYLPLPYPKTYCTSFVSNALMPNAPNKVSFQHSVRGGGGAFKCMNCISVSMNLCFFFFYPVCRISDTTLWRHFFFTVIYIPRESFFVAK